MEIKEKTIPEKKEVNLTLFLKNYLNQPTGQQISDYLKMLKTLTLYENRRSISYSLNNHLLNSFKAKNCPFLLHHYTDFTCCGIQHFGAIEALSLQKNENLKFSKKEFVQDLDLYFLLSNFLTYYSRISPLDRVSSDLKIIIKSTVAFNKRIDYNFEEEFFICDTTSTQKYLANYLHHSKIFEQVSEFKNINTHNIVKEYQFSKNYSEVFELINKYANEYTKS